MLLLMHLSMLLSMQLGKHIMLTELLNDLRSASGLQQKTEIQMVAKILSKGFTSPFPNGDDAAILPVEGGFDLFAGEGFMDEFVETDTQVRRTQ